MDFRLNDKQADTLVMGGMIAFLSILLLAWRVPPITDFLPHLNQVNAFWWALKQRDGLYTINWLAPNTLYYYLLILLDLFLPIFLAGKLLWIGILAFQFFALRGLCRKIEAPLPIYLLSCLLVFNLDFYWGFGNFLIAWSFFLWYLQTEDWGLPRKALLIMLITWAHVFFLLPLTLAEFLRWKALPKPERRLKNWIPLLTVMGWFAFWIARDFGPRSSGELTYNFSIIERLSLPWLITSVQGAMQSWTEVATVLVTLGLLIAPRVLEHARSRTAYQRQIYRIGLGLLLVAVLAPDKGMNTVRASQRWVPLAFQLMIVATSWPTSIQSSKLFRSTILGLSAMFLGATAIAWSRFQVEDLSGLKEAVGDLPFRSSLLVLDYVGFGDNFRTRSVMHAGDLAQIEKGVIPDSTFADNPAAFVRFTKERTFTQLIDWYPNRVQPSDLDLCDVALVGGPAGVHAEMVKSGRFAPMRPKGDSHYWRAYQILHK